MSRKKHTHQTKAEAHADEVVLAATATQTDGTAGENGEAKPTDPFQRATIEAQGRLQKLIKTAEELAKTRLSGTRMELLVDGLPARLEKALDAALDRVGLVRKSKLDGSSASGAKQERADRSSDGISAEAQPAE